MKILKLNSSKIAIKQLVAFVIDIAIVSLPLVLMTNLTGYTFFILLWVLYIPTAELIFNQTLGMKIVDTKIHSNTTRLQKVGIGIALRRHVARISIFWGITGWLFLFFNKQLFSDYTIVSDDYCSNDGTMEYAKKIKKYENKFLLWFVLIILLMFVGGYINNRYELSQITYDSNKQEKIIGKYIKSSDTSKELWSNASVKQIFELDKDLKKDGKALVFYIDGSIKEIADYEKDVLMHLKVFNFDETLSYELVYKDKTHMIQIDYHDDKTIDSVIEFKYSAGGEPIYDGVWIQYHYDKNYITGIRNYKDGVLNGKDSSYRDDGSLWSEVNNINGKSEGIETIYNKDGTVYATQVYKNDKVVKTDD